ncbi:MAG: transporter permease [Solirubrobacterales bacterium]|nr:transporter permease [Solirubrobacterales bacterium]
MTRSSSPALSRSSLAGDSWVIARRSFKHIRRQPEMLSDATIQPIMFVLLFAYVFGGAIAVPNGGDYKEFLLGGIFAQTVVFGCFGIAVGLTTDRSTGAIDRFRTLPIARSAVLTGRALAAVIIGLLPVVLMSLAGLIVGWRTHTGVLDVLGGYALMVLFQFAMTWVGILMGSLLSSPQAVQGVAFTGLFPVTFLASTFVPVNTLPGVLRTFAEWNPVTSLSGALRHQFGNPDYTAGTSDAWSLQHPALYTIIWAVAIIAIAAPLAVRAFNRVTGD